MKSKRILLDVVYFLLLLFFFYSGIQKVAYFRNYSFWVGHVPLLKHFPYLIKYTVPAGELVLAALLMFPKKRIWALYGAIAGNFLFVLYIFWTVWVKGFFFPLYEPWWRHENWFQKLLITLALIWVLVILILAEKKFMPIKKYFPKILRNSPASS
jgi:hypothetical protein